MKLKNTTIVLLASLFALNVDAQQQLTKEQILGMSIEELSDLSLEDLMQAVETLGVSSVDELFNLIMNKNVSSASKREESSFTSPLSSTVITRDEMRTYGISTIEEAFRLIPGMIVTEKTNGIYDIQMRGLNNIPDNNMFLYTENANTLLMIDGRPVQNYVMGSINFDFIPISIEDVERIEVVRGACSALYGANAVTGVINIITEKPNMGSKLVSGNMQFGSQNTYVGDVALRKAFNNKFAAGVSFNMQYRERPTKNLYVIPGQAGLYYCYNPQVMPAPGTQVNTPYAYGSLGLDNVLTLNGVGSVQLDENMQPVLTTLKLADGVTPQDFMTASDNFKAAYAQHQQIFGNIVDANEGGYFSVSEIDDFKQIYPTSYDANGNITSYRLFDAKEPETLGADMFNDPELARKQMAVNGYFSITPRPDISIDIMASYQDSKAAVTPVGDDIFSFNNRTSKTSHVAIDADVKGLKLLANYHWGDQDYAFNVPGFKATIRELNASVDYDFKVGRLGIRPELTAQYLRYLDYIPEWSDKENHKWYLEDPGYKYPTASYDNLSGFLNGTPCVLKTFAPSIRLDYNLYGVRLIGAYRADKTNVPDMWHHSWQFAASYSINDNNFIRFVYGRANRGTNLVNAYADFDWTRTNMVYPNKLHFESNSDEDFAKVDNFELGYRWKPTNSLLVDAEVFYSISDNYGSLMAYEGKILASSEQMKKVFAGVHSVVADDLNGDDYRKFLEPITHQMLALQLHSNSSTSLEMEPFASIKYKTLPYEVKQMGMSLNVDYIISSKLIAKVNANFQRTIIDNYFVYDQTSDIQAMLMKSQNQALSVVPNNESPLGYTVSGDVLEAFRGIAQYYVAARDANGGTEPEDVWNWDVVSKALFANHYDERRDSYMFGSTKADELDHSVSNGHKHKATPTFYGMIGLIYKPISQLEVSAFANFNSKCTYLLKYGASEMGNNCIVNMKVGYKPTQNFEVFVNGHNLLNSNKREFAHCDKIGGIYSFGVNFGF